MNALPDAEDVLHFWFHLAGPDLWFAQDPAFDHHIRQRFAALHRAATLGELEVWRDLPRGRVAEVIVLDQFSRNMFRDQAAAYASDAQALALAQEAVRSGADRALEPQLRGFLYMPYMHSESLRVHQRAIELFSQPGQQDRLHAERWHLALIERFGRYPARNAALGRESTAAELEYLRQAQRGGG